MMFKENLRFRGIFIYNLYFILAHGSSPVSHQRLDFILI